MLALLVWLALCAVSALPAVQAVTRRTCSVGSTQYWYDADTAICNTQLGPLCVALQPARTRGTFRFPSSPVSDCLVGNSRGSNFYCVPPSIDEPLITADRINLPPAAAVAAGLKYAFTINQWSTGGAANNLARSIQIGGTLPYFLPGNTVQMWVSYSDTFWRLKDFKIQTSTFQGNTNLIKGDLLDATYQNPAAVFADPTVYDQSSSVFLSSVNPVPLPLTVTSRTCDDSCKRKDANLRCNTASTKCECTPPMLPVFDGDSNQVVSCQAGEWVQYSKQFPLASLTADAGLPRGDYCMVDAKGSGFSWCQQYANINVGRQLCYNRGWHLQYRSPSSVATTDPLVFDFDCACETGNSGKYCQIPNCFREQLTQSCVAPQAAGVPVGYNDSIQAELGICSANTLERVYGFASVCTPASLFKLRGSLTLFENVNVVSGGTTWTVNAPVHYSYDDSQLAANSEAWAPSVCEFDANFFRTSSSLASQADRPFDSVGVGAATQFICEVSLPQAGSGYAPTLYKRTRLAIPKTVQNLVSYLTFDGGSNACSNPNPNSRGSAQNSTLAPCPYGTNPRLNPQRIDEVIDNSREIIRLPLNANDFGISRFWVVSFTNAANTRPSVSIVDTRQLQCLSSNQFSYKPPTGNNFCRDCVPACPENAYCSNSCTEDGLPLAQSCKTVGKCKCVDSSYDWVPGVNGAQGSCVKRYCLEGIFGPKCDQQCQECPINTRCSDNIDGDGSCVCTDPELKLNPRTNVCESQVSAAASAAAAMA